MLVELNISDFAIIDDLKIEFGHGFNALTGDTGAGKSIIIDALAAVLGDKTSPEMVRAGEQKARIEGVFDLSVLSRRHTEPIRQLLAEYGLESPDDLVILSREINLSGRSIARVNGRAVNQAALQEFGQALVDIHGQTEHLSLLRPAQHIDLLDRYADAADPRREVEERVTALRKVRKEITSCQTDERERARRCDLLSFQVKEIEETQLQPDEEDDLERERNLLANAEHLRELSDQAYRDLYAGTEPGGRMQIPSVVETIGNVSRVFAELTQVDPDLAEQESSLNDAMAILEDVAMALRKYRDTLESNPLRLTEIEERLVLIKNLKRKYGGTIQEVIDFGIAAQKELDEISSAEERLAELTERERQLRSEVSEIAGKLSDLRQEAAGRLATEAEQALAELGMGKVAFQVSLERREDPDGVEITPGGDRFAFDTKGVDRAEFLIALNPGEPLKPLAKVASGGETSRLMLALKSILSRADATPTLVFDEIDVGIGGRSGQVVGEKLWNLAKDHQVICITHLAQVAAFGDDHFTIEKVTGAGRTTSRVIELETEERLRELAAMLGGQPIKPASLETAREILDSAAEWKTEHASMAGQEV